MPVLIILTGGAGCAGIVMVVVIGIGIGVWPPIPVGKTGIAAAFFLRVNTYTNPKPNESVASTDNIAYAFFILKGWVYVGVKNFVCRVFLVVHINPYGYCYNH